MRKIYTPNFKSKVAIDAIKAEHTMSELSSRHSVNRVMIQRWKKEAMEGLPKVFAGKSDKSREKDQQLMEELYRQIGRLKVENDWLKKNL
jgi:transposase